MDKYTQIKNLSYEELLKNEKNITEGYYKALDEFVSKIPENTPQIKKDNIIMQFNNSAYCKEVRSTLNLIEARITEIKTAENLIRLNIDQNVSSSKDNVIDFKEAKEIYKSFDGDLIPLFNIVSKTASELYFQKNALIKKIEEKRLNNLLSNEKADFLLEQVDIITKQYNNNLKNENNKVM